MSEPGRMDDIPLCRNMLNLFFFYKSHWREVVVSLYLKSERPGGGSDLCGGGSLLHLWEDSAQQGEVKNGFVQ